MDIAASLIPGTKRSGRDILPDAFFGSTKIGEFPIVNRSCAVRGQVRDPALIEERGDDLHRTILNQVRAVDQNHAAAAFARLVNFFGDLADGGSYFRSCCRRRLLRIDYEVVNRA